jgi:peroxiredoxin
MKSRIFLTALIIIGAGVIVLLQTKDSFRHRAQNSWPKKGSPAPNFTLPDLTGSLVSLADFRGKVVLLNIWATWCLPCVEEMPSMEKLHREMEGEDFIILAVSIDNTGAEVVIPFVEKHDLSFTVLVDRKATLKSLFQATGVPESIIIDQKGIIVEKVIGARNWASAEILGYFRSLIQSK